MENVKMPHPGHDKHLCYLNNLRLQDIRPEEYKKLIKNPKFFCQNCGRAAADSANLCKPKEL